MQIAHSAEHIISRELEQAGALSMGEGITALLKCRFLMSSEFYVQKF